MNEQHTIIAFSENAVGLLNRITIIFTRRHINIESLTVSESSIKGIHKFTIVIDANKDLCEKVTKQIEKQVEVLKAFYYTNDEIIYQEIALYKVPTDKLIADSSVETLVRKGNARIIEVTPDYTVIEKTGHESETGELFEQLNSTCGVKQFSRTGRIAVTRGNLELLTAFLSERSQG